MSRICIICGKEFVGKTNAITCSLECRKRRYKEVSRKNSKIYKQSEKYKEYMREWRKENAETVNRKKREWYKKTNQSEKRKKKIDKLHGIEYTSEQLELFMDLAGRQQFLEDYDRNGSCIICGLEGKMIIHHIKYNPQETVLMCNKCHSRLHIRFLNGKKCKPY